MEAAEAWWRFGGRFFKALFIYGGEGLGWVGSNWFDGASFGLGNKNLVVLLNHIAINIVFSQWWTLNFVLITSTIARMINPKPRIFIHSLIQKSSFTRRMG